MIKLAQVHSPFNLVQAPLAGSNLCPFSGSLPAASASPREPSTATLSFCGMPSTTQHWFPLLRKETVWLFLQMMPIWGEEEVLKAKEKVKEVSVKEARLARTGFVGAAEEGQGCHECKREGGRGWGENRGGEWALLWKLFHRLRLKFYYHDIYASN